MRAILIGGVVAVVVVGAFIFGANYEDSASDGQLEQLGEQLDEKVNDAQRAVEDSVD